MPRTTWNFVRATLVGIMACMRAGAQPVELPPPEVVPPRPKPALFPRIDLSAHEWNFGDVWQGEPLEFEVTIRNLGDDFLTLDVKSSCGCAVASKPRSPLEPGGQDRMKISYDSRHKLGKANQTVTITCNDPVTPVVSIGITGNVSPLYKLHPEGGIAFGQLFQKSNETRKVELTSLYKEPLLLKLKPQQELGSYSVELRELEAGRRYELTATTRPPLPVGTLQVPVLLETNLNMLPEIRVNVYGFVQPPVSVQPATLRLPKNSVLDIRRVVKVTYAPDEPIEIRSVRSNVESIRAEVRPAPPGTTQATRSQHDIVVTLPPGDRIPDGVAPQIEIETTSRDPQYRTLIIPVQIVMPAPATAPAPQPAPDGRTPPGPGEGASPPQG